MLLLRSGWLGSACCSRRGGPRPSLKGSLGARWRLVTKARSLESQRHLIRAALRSSPPLCLRQRPQRKNSLSTDSMRPFLKRQWLKKQLCVLPNKLKPCQSACIFKIQKFFSFDRAPNLSLLARRVMLTPSTITDSRNIRKNVNWACNT